MARFSFRLPDIGEGIAEAEIVAWHVRVGDRIEEDSQLADMMTDKATVEMESPVSGIVVELAGEVGDMVSIGSTLAVIETEGEGVDDAPPADTPVEEEIVAETPGTEEVTVVEVAPAPAPAPATAPEPVPAPETPAAHSRAVLASPAVRARARDLGVDLGQVHAEGDRIRHADLDAFLRYSGGQGYHAPGASRARADEPVRVIGMRRKIAENMAASKRTIPHFTYVEEMDVTALEDMRADLNANRGNRPKLTMLPFLIVAICRTIPQFPMINARYDDEGGVVTRYGAVHLGMATQTDAGLMVPVIRDAQDKNVWQLASEISRLAEAARTGKAKVEELTGGTLTVTSLGPLGGIATTPVINRPEVAIIGPNKIVERPVFDGDDIRRAKLMNLSISCDHRVVDGWDAASYVQALKKLIETPVLLFAD
ncbi:MULTISPECIES: dihydrolipoamide acetyltransferase family protein [unclassified Sphingopyxis]|uniref:dihydrolipoamide acetyltransferase family protein n=1 Tax=unclassified Sphingopyxis TaxID=2614943 RepID=UPI0007312FCA|nr:MULTISPECIES: dihydrolipoamide acetyltransferase family protein [unclassified Sphingopyxis]KTE23167.1 branched-chain alpha-keto acid dehydrogenase subunit E2 [Sphingopyxis sp. H057]KTE49405.1 branched-chain alpha-keto acid dehydrogenase subunit E2 [Sphingopyxis sp. H073]KTE50105.1 branched-chain alpha-keto acid dehydrogenase subunit E2 [Sphingopyxis sp. H071]KTE58488.1 branched-chain alpha-keto acid dehydrogenase subunit E2 [Sphingopyxis sp. H107]KTE63187.1 branched-chain alpha-keto acid de